MAIQQRTRPDDKNLMIDDRLDSYQSFFDHGWARSLFELVQQTKLDPLALDLCADWKGAANTARLPWLIVHSLESYHTGYSQTKEPFWQQLTMALRAHLLDRTKHSFNLTKQRELVRMINRLSEDIQKKRSEAPPSFDRHQVWASFLEIQEFLLSLWSSQRLCYGAVYYAYENFLRQSVSIGMKKPTYKPRRADDLREDLNVLFGSSLGDTCLGDSRIILARRVRNALVHSGGRPTAELLSAPGDLTIVGGMIHIMPPHVRALYDLLKECVTTLAQKGRALAEFRR